MVQIPKLLLRHRARKSIMKGLAEQRKYGSVLLFRINFTSVQAHPNLAIFDRKKKKTSSLVGLKPPKLRIPFPIEKKAV